MFRLDPAIAAWRRSLRFSRSFSVDDLDELEVHLRDHIDALVADGLDEEAAFHQALHRLGPRGAVEAEYRKVRWVRPKRRRTFLATLLWDLTMLHNYLKIALRALRKHPGYAVINVTGLAVGMACCLLLFLLIRHEWSYDRFHAHTDRLYRTTLQYTQPDSSTEYQNMMFPDFTPALAAEFPAIEHATRFVQGGQDLQVGNEFFQQIMVEVDPSFFQMFSFPLAAGDPATVLADKSGMVITTDVAQAFFGVNADRYADALGRTVSLTRDAVTYDFTVTGVAEPPPATSSLQFDVVISFENYDDIYLGGNNWGGRTSTYILLAPDQDAAAFEEALQPFIRTQFADYADELRNDGFLAEGDDALHMQLQPLPDMHRSPEVWVAYAEQPHDPLYSYVLAGIGLLVLLIACINFMTLSVGQSAGRAREVGMRKVLGAHRGQLMKQFWGEAGLLTAIALVLGLGLALAALPFFNEMTNQALSLAMLPWYELVLAVVVLLVVVGFVAGGYPAAVLSRFQPAVVFKGAVKARGNNFFTRSLVVLQYTISIGLIVSTLIMAQQLQYLLNKDLGFDDDLVLVVHTGQVSRADAPRVLDHFRNTLLPYDQVTRVARAGYSFTRGTDRNTWTDADGITRSAYNFGVDADYIDVMGMEIVDGRTFSRDFPTDSTRSILVNEALVREFGIEDPVGKKLTGWLDWIYEDDPTIIGVVKDFNFQSLREEVYPTVMNMHPDYYSYMGAVLLKVKPDDLTGTIERVEQTWAEVLPGKPFSYSFLDDDLAAQYQTEQRWSRIVTYSAILAILIACLGLFGLATLSVTRRTKEIGIRKVLGASVPDVVVLVAGEFVKLVAVAAVLAWPLAYFGMHRWLRDFAYRIEISWPIFLLAGLAALGVALLTVSYQSIRAARANPVESLRYE